MVGGFVWSPDMEPESPFEWCLEASGLPQDGNEQNEWSVMPVFFFPLAEAIRAIGAILLIF